MLKRLVTGAGIAVLMACCLLIGAAGYACASEAWTYQDASDSEAKTEGGYAAVDDPVQNSYSNPHGGYATTSNRCKTCHAVHRSEGAYGLTRVDSPDDACNYCHVGAARHAESQAYFQDADGLYAENGHTIGAGPEIPASSVWQWSTEETVAPSGVDPDYIDLPESRAGWYRPAEESDEESETILVRRHDPKRVKMMRFVLHGERWVRVGPVRLRCSTCHQVHNAYRQTWHPVSSVDGSVMEGGYKLLRDNPSGMLSVNPEDVEQDGQLGSSLGPRATARTLNQEYDPADMGAADGLSSTEDDYRIRALESTITLETGEGASGAQIMGANLTGYTPFMHTSSETSTVSGETLPVYETSLSFWCANCHNRTLSGARQRDAEGMVPSASIHEWPHPVPGMFAQGTQTEAGSQCYDCHNNDMPLDATLGDACGGCHISPKMYRYYKSGERIQGKTWEERAAEREEGDSARSDFPHSGPATSRDLLSARDRIGVSPSGDPDDDDGRSISASDGAHKVCRTCHAPGAYNNEVYLR